jgi:hypothetical protein
MQALAPFASLDSSPAVDPTGPESGTTRIRRERRRRKLPLRDASLKQQPDQSNQFYRISSRF